MDKYGYKNSSGWWIKSENAILKGVEKYDSMDNTTQSSI